MKKIIWKAYYDYEKEENWLNEMAAKGLAMTNYSWCRYVFEECEPNEYTYRLELLDNLATHTISQRYIDFLEDSGVEQVASYLRWIYLRKKTSEGTFDVYTDIDSKIMHNKRIYKFWITFMIIELAIGFSNISIGLANMKFNEGLLLLININLICGILLVLMGVHFLRLGLPIRKKIKNLEREQLIRE